MKNSSLCSGFRFPILLAALTLAGAPSKAATVVDWGSPDYVTANQNLALPTPVVSPGSTTQSRVWNWSASNAISPAAGYGTPTGKSTVFYGGAWLNVTGSGLGAAASSWSVAAVYDEASGNDTLQYYRGSPAGTLYSGAAFTAFLKPDFLSDGESRNVQFDMTSSMSVTAAALTSGKIYLAVLDGAQWYLSETTRSTLGSLSLAGGGLLDSKWGAWNPSGGTGARLGDAPSVFGTLGSDFTEINGFGVYVAFNAPSAGSSVRFIMSSFQADAAVIPEPRTTALMFPLLAIGMMFARQAWNAKTS